MIELHRAGADPGSSLIFEAQRLERLASDLRKMADGQFPCPSDLMSAPTITRWTWAVRPMMSLEGFTSGHPRLGTTTVRTTEVWAIDLQAGWARTLSRLYVLGDAHRYVGH
ncbi:DUF6634 family protein [Pseudoroseomonas cervicalis]|jgi:hypothetical protein|uniref:DUF6634 family protein n=1 Tax=Teichococcus cervicalis TaxID=204525 RepID=UPI0034A0AA87